MSSFTGKHNGHISKHELSMLPNELVHACQKKAWFDGTTLMWINQILVPHVATAPEGITPILFLASFLVHMKATVINAIQDLGVQVEFIPPGCTGLLQPVDVGYNKAFKAKLRIEYNGRLLQQDPDLPIPGTTHRDIADWIIAAERNITNETLKNSSRKTGYSYFGVFHHDGEFEGDNRIVSDDPNEPDNIEFGSDADAVYADRGLSDSSSPDEDDTEANKENEGIM
jgi:hypothetical protein